MSTATQNSATQRHENLPVGSALGHRLRDKQPRSTGGDQCSVNGGNASRKRTTPSALRIVYNLRDPCQWTRQFYVRGLAQSHLWGCSLAGRHARLWPSNRKAISLQQVSDLSIVSIPLLVFGIKGSLL